MILGTAKGSANVPEGAIELSREEALSHQKNVVENWSSVTEVFFLRFGRYVGATCTFISAAACINAFHPLLKLGKGTITTVIPAITIPTGLVYYKMDDLYGSIGFPGLIGLLSTNAGYNIHYNKADAREYWKKTFEVAKTQTHIFNRILFTQIMVAFTIPYFQNSEIINIMKNINENQRKEVPEEVL